jgi:hypothetical protein
MTPSVFHFAFRDQRDGERRASVPGNNPAWEHMFHPVPDVENVQIPAIAGNKIRLEIEKWRRPRGGIKPVKSAAKVLYAVQSCYEGSPSRPRGVIVGGRRFA